MKRIPRLLASILTLGPLSACSGVQSALAPTGAEAGRVSTLFWVMTIGGGLIFLFVLACAALAIFGGTRARSVLSSERFINGAGIAFPIVVLTTLLLWGLSLMGIQARSGEGAEWTVSISGEQWWWRVTYESPDGRVVEAANELHVPVGEPVRLELTTADVIHSFWAPQLAGKLDMIPGRTNAMTVTATQAGVSRGQCAEYCGGAHALMSFFVVAQDPEDFAAWFGAEAADALPPDTETERQGQQLFIETGCGSCHAVRGTGASGEIGPDLTHLGSRRSLGAATMTNSADSIASWIINNQHIKPDNRMPEYDIFSGPDLDALAAYLEGLE